MAGSAFIYRLLIQHACVPGAGYQGSDDGSWLPSEEAADEDGDGREAYYDDEDADGVGAAEGVEGWQDGGVTGRDSDDESERTSMFGEGDGEDGMTGGAGEERKCSEWEQMLNEVEAADVWGLMGGMWHSAFYGRPPACFIDHQWFLRMIADEQEALAAKRRVSSTAAHGDSQRPQQDAAEGSEDTGGAGVGEIAGPDAARCGIAPGRGGGSSALGSVAVGTVETETGPRRTVGAAGADEADAAGGEWLREMLDAHRARAERVADAWCDQRGVAIDDVVRESGIFRLKMTNKSMQECICTEVSNVAIEVSHVAAEDIPPQDDPQKHAEMSCLCTWVSGLRLWGRSASE